MSRKSRVDMSREWLCAQLDKGLTAQQMATIAGISRTRIYGRLHEEGIRMPSKNRPESWVKGKTAETHEGVRKFKEARTGIEMTFDNGRDRVDAISRTRLEMFSGVVIDKDGYRQVWDRGRRRYIREHRAVAEKLIGRRLPSQIIVHHMDEDTKNNDPRNLMLLRRREHSAIHAAMAAQPNIDQIEWLTAKKMPHIWLGKYTDGEDQVNHAAA